MKQQPQHRPAARLPLLDQLRGLSILAMVLYHGVYDLVAFYGFSGSRLEKLLDSPPVARLLHPGFVGLFLLLCGFSCRLSRNNLRRGMGLLGMGLALTALTWMAQPLLPASLITFGILHLMGSGVLLFVLLRPLLDRGRPAVWFLGLLGLFFLTCSLPQGWVGLGGWRWFALPRWDGPVFPLGALRFVLGLPAPGCSSADYFPLLPWAPLLLAGSCLGRMWRQGQLPLPQGQPRFPRLAWVGRRTLWVYLLHQPALLLVLSLLLGRMPGWG